MTDKTDITPASGRRQWLTGMFLPVVVKITLVAFQDRLGDALRFIQVALIASTDKTPDRIFPQLRENSE